MINSKKKTIIFAGLCVLVVAVIIVLLVLNRSKNQESGMLFFTLDVADGQCAHNVYNSSGKLLRSSVVPVTERKTQTFQEFQQKIIDMRKKKESFSWSKGVVAFEMKIQGYSGPILWKAYYLDPDGQIYTSGIEERDFETLNYAVASPVGLGEEYIFSPGVNPYSRNEKLDYASSIMLPGLSRLAVHVVYGPNNEYEMLIINR